MPEQQVYFKKMRGGWLQLWADTVYSVPDMHRGNGRVHILIEEGRALHQKEPVHQQSMYQQDVLREPAPQGM
jgi:hypothetical protein